MDAAEEAFSAFNLGVAMAKGGPTRGEKDEGTTIDPPDDLQASLVRLGSRPYVLLNFTLRSAARPLRLTPAERTGAVALLEGLSNAEIACLRGSASRTVANQIAAIYRKLGVRSRAELAARWANSLSPIEK